MGDLRGISGTETLSVGERNPGETFEKRRLAGALVANNDELGQRHVSADIVFTKLIDLVKSIWTRESHTRFGHFDDFQTVVVGREKKKKRAAYFSAKVRDGSGQAKIEKPMAQKRKNMEKSGDDKGDSSEAVEYIKVVSEKGTHFAPFVRMELCQSSLICRMTPPTHFALPPWSVLWSTHEVDPIFPTIRHSVRLVSFALPITCG